MNSKTFKPRPLKKSLKNRAPASSDSFMMIALSLRRSSTLAKVGPNIGWTEAKRAPLAA